MDEDWRLGPSTVFLQYVRIPQRRQQAFRAHPPGADELEKQTLPSATSAQVLLPELNKTKHTDQ